MSFQTRKRFLAPPDVHVTAHSPRPSLPRRGALLWSLWRERIAVRRRLAEMDARSLRDAGISPAAAAYESGKPFWRSLGGLR